jgi:hypothetical protein
MSPRALARLAEPLDEDEERNLVGLLKVEAAGIQRWALGGRRPHV